MTQLAGAIEEASRLLSLLHRVELAHALGEEERVTNILAGVDPIDCAALAATLRIVASGLRTHYRAEPTRSPVRAADPPPPNDRPSARVPNADGQAVLDAIDRKKFRPHPTNHPGFSVRV